MEEDLQMVLLVAEVTKMEAMPICGVLAVLLGQEDQPPPGAVEVEAEPLLPSLVLPMVVMEVPMEEEVAVEPLVVVFSLLLPQKAVLAENMVEVVEAPMVMVLVALMVVMEEMYQQPLLMVLIPNHGRMSI